MPPELPAQVKTGAEVKSGAIGPIMSQFPLTKLSNEILCCVADHLSDWDLISLSLTNHWFLNLLGVPRLTRLRERIGVPLRTWKWEPENTDERARKIAAFRYQIFFLWSCYHGHTSIVKNLLAISRANNLPLGMELKPANVGLSLSDTYRVLPPQGMPNPHLHPSNKPMRINDLLALLPSDMNKIFSLESQVGYNIASTSGQVMSFSDWTLEGVQSQSIDILFSPAYEISAPRRPDLNWQLVQIDYVPDVAASNVFRQADGSRSFPPIIFFPLSLAALNGHLELVKTLVDAEKTPCNTPCYLPFWIPTGQGFDELPEPMTGVEPLVAPLLAAVHDGHTDVVDFILKSGASRDQLCVYPEVPMSAIHVAVSSPGNSRHMTEFLLDRGFGDNGRLAELNLSGLSPVLLANLNGNSDQLAMLRDAGADLDQEMGKSSKGCTALMHACMFGFFEGARKLIEAGADTNVKFGALPSGPTDVMWDVDGYFRRHFRNFPLGQTLKDNGYNEFLRPVIGLNPIQLCVYLIGAEWRLAQPKDLAYSKHDPVKPQEVIDFLSFAVDHGSTRGHTPSWLLELPILLFQRQTGRLSDQKRTHWSEYPNWHDNGRSEILDAVLNLQKSRNLPLTLRDEHGNSLIQLALLEWDFNSCQIIVNHNSQAYVELARRWVTGNVGRFIDQFVNKSVWSSNRDRDTNVFGMWPLLCADGLQLMLNVGIISYEDLAAHRLLPELIQLAMDKTTESTFKIAMARKTLIDLIFELPNISRVLENSHHLSSTSSHPSSCSRSDLERLLWSAIEQATLDIDRRFSFLGESLNGEQFLFRLVGIGADINKPNPENGHLPLAELINLFARARRNRGKEQYVYAAAKFLLNHGAKVHVKPLTRRQSPDPKTEGANPVIACYRAKVAGIFADLFLDSARGGPQNEEIPEEMMAFYWEEMLESHPDEQVALMLLDRSTSPTDPSLRLPNYHIQIPGLHRRGRVMLPGPPASHLTYPDGMVWTFGIPLVCKVMQRLAAWTREWGPKIRLQWQQGGAHVGLTKYPVEPLVHILGLLLQRGADVNGRVQGSNMSVVDFLRKLLNSDFGHSGAVPFTDRKLGRDDWDHEYRPCFAILKQLTVSKILKLRGNSVYFRFMWWDPTSEDHGSGTKGNGVTAEEEQQQLSELEKVDRMLVQDASKWNWFDDYSQQYGRYGGI